MAELSNAAVSKLDAGVPEEEVARWAVAERNILKQAYRDLTPESILGRIAARTLERYGNEMGPSVDDLRSAGKSSAILLVYSGTWPEKYWVTHRSHTAHS